MIATLFFSAMLATAVPAPVIVAGQLAYDVHCSSCHGADLRGGINGPPLRGAGAAQLDFWMQTGRMPAAVPWIQVGHRGPQISPGEIGAIEAYVTSVAPGGLPIPAIVAGGNIMRGRALFTENCEHCHGVDGNGAAIGDLAFAPSLHAASITQVAEAVRVGLGSMPKFAATQLDAHALTDVASYVFALDDEAASTTFPLRSSGAVPEGLDGWLAVGFLALVAYAFAKLKKPPAATADRHGRRRPAEEDQS